MRVNTLTLAGVFNNQDEVFLKNYESAYCHVAAIVQERERVAGELEKIGFKVFPSRGNFFLVQCGGREETLWRFLQDRGIVVKFLSRLPVTGDALRITVGTPEENDLLISRSRDFFVEGGTNAQG